MLVWVHCVLQESNGLDRYNIDYMYAPPGTDMLLGSSRQRQLIMWQYNRMGAYRCAGREGGRGRRGSAAGGGAHGWWCGGQV